MDDKTTSRTVRRNRWRARRAPWARLRAGTATAEDRDAVVDDIVAKMNPVGLRIAEISQTFDRANDSAARQAAAQRIMRGEGAWPTDSEFGEASIPLGTEVVDTMADAYGVPAWFLTNTGTDPLADIDLSHELRLYRVSTLRLTRYGAYDCPAHPVINESDTQTLLTAARRALTASIFPHLGFGVVLLFMLDVAVMMGVAIMTTMPWFGVLILLVVCASTIVSVRAWGRDLRTILTARRLPSAEFSRYVQLRLQRHIGNTLHWQLTTPTARPHIQRIICHSAPIGYSTLTAITQDPRTTLRNALRSTRIS